MPFVLDASVALAWCFEDEGNGFAESVLDSLEQDSAVVPAIWPFEVANALLSAERRGRVTRGDTARFSELLRALPIELDQRATDRMFDSIMDTARAQNLSIYDASYVELAMRTGYPIATGDSRILAAAVAVGVKLVDGH